MKQIIIVCDRCHKKLDSEDYITINAKRGDNESYSLPTSFKAKTVCGTGSNKFFADTQLTVTRNNFDLCNHCYNELMFFIIRNIRLDKDAYENIQLNEDRKEEE